MKKGRGGRERYTGYNLSHMADLKRLPFSPTITTLWLLGFFMLKCITKHSDVYCCFI